jgi:tRNA-specific 2-thiouridylase
VATGERRFVTNIDPQLNVVTIGPEEALYASGLRAGALRWVAGEPPAASFDAAVKIRYRSTSVPACVRVADASARVTFERPQRAVTPGQAVVFYRNNEVLGGGIIESAERLTEQSKAATLAEHFS